MEFAIVLPVLMLIILGIIDFGRFYNYANQESQLAAEAARWAAVNFQPANGQTLQSYVTSQATGGLQSAGGDVTSPAQVYLYYPSGSADAVGNSLRACVVASVQLFPMIGGFTVPIVESATMRTEQLATNWSTAGNPGAVPSACPTS